MEEELKRIECLIERCNQCKLNACITCDICWSEVQAIEKLLEQYKHLAGTTIRLSRECVELEEENRKIRNLATHYKIIHESTFGKPTKDYIHKSVIQNKKNEYEKMLKATYTDPTYSGDNRRRECLEALQVLQELLEERK